MNIGSSPDGTYIYRDDHIQLTLKDLREERTGLHGRLGIFVGDKIYANSTFNLWRDEERVRLANSAYTIFGDILKTAYPRELLKHTVDLFCLEVEASLHARYIPELLVGEARVGQAIYWLDPYIVRGGGTILFGTPGSGKSWLALLMAVSVDAGSGEFWTVQQTRVGFVNLERSAASLRHRLWNVNHMLGLDPSRPLPVLNARGQSLHNVTKGLRKFIIDQKIELIVVDSISRAGEGNTNENDTGNRIVDTLNALAPSWLAIGHPTRQDQTHIGGTIMFDAGADVLVQVKTSRVGVKLGAFLAVTKANDTAIPPQQGYSLVFDEEEGLTEVYKTDLTEYPDIAAAMDKTTKAAIKGAMEELGGMASAVQIAELTGLQRNHISTELKNSPLYAFHHADGRTRFYAMLTTRPVDEPLRESKDPPF